MRLSRTLEKCFACGGWGVITLQELRASEEECVCFLSRTT